MGRQYKPFSYKIGEIPLIIYGGKDEHPLSEIFDPKDHHSIQKHLEQLYDKHPEVLNKGTYHIVLVWNLDQQRMTDVWIHTSENWSNTSGPLIECVTFRNLEKCTDAGIASGDSIIMVAREEELRRELDNLALYFDRSQYIPTFPDGMQPTEVFYV